MQIKLENITQITVNKLVDFRRESSDERQRDMDAILKIAEHALKCKTAGFYVQFAGSMT